MPQVKFNILGGPFNGYSPKQTITNYKQAEVLNMRKVITRSWANINTADTVNAKNEY